MTQRRSFLKGLVAAAVATSLEVFGHVTPKAPPIIRKRLVTRINPAYLNATYEMEYYFHPKVLQMMDPTGIARPVHSPVRGADRWEFKNGQYIRVPYFITEEEDE